VQLEQPELVEESQQRVPLQLLALQLVALQLVALQLVVEESQQRE
jgi:hypothetical protein